MVAPLTSLSDEELEQFAFALDAELTDEAVEQLAIALGIASVSDPAPLLTPGEYQGKLAAEASFYEFVRQCWSVVEPDVDFIEGWHVEAICGHLEAIVTGDIPNLLINIPPGCMKSLCTSVFLPAWAWIHRPAMRFLYASYEQGLSTRDSVRCRQIVDSEWYKRRWGDRFRLTGDQNEKTKFENSERGWRIATSVGGRGTGEHPDVIVCDDPHKVKESESVKEREAAIRWWDGTISSRGKVRGARRVVIMQRLHEDDLSGHILETDAGVGRWDHICLPMRYEAERMGVTRLGWTDPRSEDGDLLWPGAFGEDKVAELEREMTSLRAAGQLQQRPAPMGGEMFHRDWFSIVDASPVDGDRVRYYDKAGTDGGGAYTAGVLMSLAPDGFLYVENVVREQLSPARRNKLIKQTSQMDAARHKNSVDVWVEQEPGSSGKFDAENTVRELMGIPCYIDKVTGSKEIRAAPFAAQCEVGNVRLVRGDWNEAFLAELEHFPTGKYKDQVDAAGGAFQKLTGGNIMALPDELIASGDDPDEHRPMSDKELAELPDYLREIVEASRGGSVDRTGEDPDELPDEALDDWGF